MRKISRYPQASVWPISPVRIGPADQSGTCGIGTEEGRIGFPSESSIATRCRWCDGLSLATAMYPDGARCDSSGVLNRAPWLSSRTRRAV